jgi:3-oxoacyl-[acyl-carrier protein] reductase
VTSISVRQPIANLMLSNTARAALTAFLKTLALEVAPDGVTVNSLQPGLHATERLTALHGNSDDVAASIPARRFGEPADFGAFAAFLCSEHAGFVTGAAIPVDGGAYGGLQ